jgi:hypothetical protein
MWLTDDHGTVTLSFLPSADVLLDHAAAVR